MPKDNYQPRHAAGAQKKSVDRAIAKNTKSAPKKKAPTSSAPRQKYQKKTQSRPPRKSKNKSFKLWWKRRSKKQKTVIIIAALLVLILLVVGIFIWSKLRMVGTKTDEPVGKVEEELDFGDDKNASSLNGVLKKWSTNKVEKMSDKDIKNILLVGLDPVSGCTDTMMLVSVNTKTKVITMASFYRDSYTYYEGKSGSSYHKLNAVKSLGGGIEYTIKAIENDYKIKIDDYAMVNYNTFQSVVNSLGGVDVYVTAKEAAFLNETWYEWAFSGKPPARDFVEGTNHMDGEMALTFCRIRKLDSDVNRTERQRRVISSIMSSMKNANLSQVNNCINSVLPYISTGMSNSEILATASSAVAGGWLKYDIKQTPMPTEKLCKAGWAGSQWIWVCDFEAAAQELQTMLYGETNIKLADDRKSALDFAS